VDLQILPSRPGRSSLDLLLVASRSLSRRARRVLSTEAHPDPSFDEWQRGRGRGFTGSSESTPRYVKMPIHLVLALGCPLPSRAPGPVWAGLALIARRTSCQSWSFGASIAWATTQWLRFDSLEWGKTWLAISISFTQLLVVRSHLEVFIKYTPCVVLGFKTSLVLEVQ
jgi:hypothetical protein